MWKFTSENAYPNIILHDCRIAKVSLQNKTLVFEFDDSGFWIVENNKENPFGKTLRTDKAEICFHGFDKDYFCFYTFKPFKLLGRTLFIRMVEISFEEFVLNVNSGKWEPEFIEEFYGLGAASFEGEVFFNKKPYRYRFQMQLSFEKMEYNWNEICEDRPW